MWVAILNKNKREAFKRLIKSSKFKIWHTEKVNEVLEGKTLEEKLEESLNKNNLKIEIKCNGKWEEVQDG